MSLTEKDPKQPGEREYYGFQLTGVQSGEYIDTDKTQVIVQAGDFTKFSASPISLANVQSLEYTLRDSQGQAVDGTHVLPVAAYDNAYILLEKDNLLDVTSDSLISDTLVHWSDPEPVNVKARFIIPETIDGLSSEGNKLKITFTVWTNTGRKREKEFLIPIESV